MFMTDELQIFKVYLNLLEADNIFYIILFLSVWVSILFTLFDLIFTDRIMRFFPARLTSLFKSIIYFSSAFEIILIASRSPITIFKSKDYSQVLDQLPDMNIDFIRFLAHFYLSIIINHFIKGLASKMERGNLRNWMFGLLNKPREATRIFMFIDMKSSTTIAEKLEHKKFSYLIQDVFNDMAVVGLYKADIYSYVGDGAVITWSVKRGLKNNNFLRAYYAFVHVINKRKRYYNRKYGIIPKFKAGVHIGKVMVLQVGQIRRDISYNGDTINTAARIESMCNNYHQDLLISGDLYNMIKDKKGFQFKVVDNIKLRGKRKSIDIYQIKKKKY